MLPVSLMKWTEGPHYSEISMNYFKPESRKDRLVEPKNMNVELSSNNRTPLLIYTMGRFAANR